MHSRLIDYNCICSQMTILQISQLTTHNGMHRHDNSARNLLLLQSMSVDWCDQHLVPIAYRNEDVKAGSCIAGDPEIYDPFKVVHSKSSESYDIYTRNTTIIDRKTETPSANFEALHTRPQ